MKQVHFEKVGRYLKIHTSAQVPLGEGQQIVRHLLLDGYKIYPALPPIPPLVTTEDWLHYLAILEPGRWMTLSEIVRRLVSIGWYSEAIRPEKWVGQVLLHKEDERCSWAHRRIGPARPVRYWLGPLDDTERDKAERYAPRILQTSLF